MRRTSLAGLFLACALAAASCGGHAGGIADVSTMCNLGTSATVSVLLHGTSSEPRDDLLARYRPRLCGTTTTFPSGTSAAALTNVSRRAGGVWLFAPFAPGGMPLEERSQGNGTFGYQLSDKRLADCGGQSLLLVRGADPDFQVALHPPPVITLTAPLCPGKRCGPISGPRPLDLRWVPASGPDMFVLLTVTGFGGPREVETFADCAVPAGAGGVSVPLPSARWQEIRVELSALSWRMERAGGWYLGLSTLGASEHVRFGP